MLAPAAERPVVEALPLQSGGVQNRQNTGWRKDRLRHWVGQALNGHRRSLPSTVGVDSSGHSLAGSRLTRQVAKGHICRALFQMAQGKRKQMPGLVSLGADARQLETPL